MLFGTVEDDIFKSDLGLKKDTWYVNRQSGERNDNIIRLDAQVV